VQIPSLTITFLGTGTSSGVPMIGCDCEVCTSTDPNDNRLRSSVLIQSQQTSLVVDTTPDFRYQMLRINNRRLDAVVYTHQHKDHLAGLDDIRAYNYFTKKPMDIYANTLTEEALRRDYYYAFSDTRYPGVPELNLITIDEHPFFVGDIPVLLKYGIIKCLFLVFDLVISPISRMPIELKHPRKKKYVARKYWYLMRFEKKIIFRILRWMKQLL